ncbi:TIGR03364 family FAD-dependent oxidoreductase [Gluconacetobacter asukensis]|uniref:TIGR03364 family FAD-dependent oxidoreductase n=1 Tax=Gluconacetobacter asukensis TaxID=1017181 RepID=A0A7W4NYQ7_9PROT|nr:TIGR03364 family FAD-dependent oxidoreductase [Gluconacetobacter asukensis]MBB2170834.1 TIGR03364 family FAD-dependent oxidoreductase [Gluconacetobacter asukensis]
MTAGYDLAIVGAGICGLAHALIAARRGRRVIVIDRDLAANGASIRNFGFITVSGQERGRSWGHARRSRDIWAEIAPDAGIAVHQRGLLVLGRRPETMAVLEAFRQDEMGAGCTLLSREALSAWPGLRGEAMLGALYSPHELRVESHEAIPRLARWLEERHGVTFLRGASVFSVAPPRLETSRGTIHADAAIVCPGDDFHTLFPDRIRPHGLTRCKLQMMRLAPGGIDAAQPAVMSDLGVGRYRGYHHLAGHAALMTRLEAEQPDYLAAGIHLIAVRAADGSQIVGDSHVYADQPDPFSDERVDDLIQSEHASVHRATPPVVSRWTGTYASGPETMLMERISDSVRLVIVSSGTGASTSFGIAEETLADLWG